MKKIPIKLQRIIKRKRFSFNNTADERNWRGRLKINYRITWIVAQGEDYYESRSPFNPGYSPISVNVKVSGKVETATNRYDSKTNRLVDLKEVVGKYKRQGGTMDGWNSYYNDPYDSKWGYQAHKKVREEIRSQVKDDIKNYLKLMGIVSENRYDGIQVKNISWE